MYQCTLAVTFQAAVCLCCAAVPCATGTFPGPELTRGAPCRNCLPEVFPWSPAQSVRDTQGAKYVPNPKWLSEQPVFLNLTRFQPSSFPRSLRCLMRQGQNGIFLTASVRTSDQSASSLPLSCNVKWPFAMKQKERRLSAQTFPGTTALLLYGSFFMLPVQG